MKKTKLCNQSCQIVVEDAEAEKYFERCDELRGLSSMTFKQEENIPGIPGGVLNTVSKAFKCTLPLQDLM